MITFSIKKIPVNRNVGYFWIFFAIIFIFQYITAVIVNRINPELTSTNFEFADLSEEFIIIVIIAPVLETLIFQYLVIETLMGLKCSPLSCVVASGLLFGVSHWYNLAYIMVLTIVGFLFAYYYLALRNQNNLNKVILIILMHALLNTFSFINNNFFDLTY